MGTESWDPDSFWLISAIMDAKILERVLVPKQTRSLDLDGRRRRYRWTQNETDTAAGLCTEFWATETQLRKCLERWANSAMPTLDTCAAQSHVR